MTYFKEIPLSTWAQFKAFAEPPRLESIFRGQSNSVWELQTTLERSGIVEYFEEFEDELIFEFKRGAKFYLKEEHLPTTLLEWFSMIQHFGAPSRLLDFTKSPYVAAYFAFEQASEDYENIAIWVINKNFFYQKSLYYFEKKIDDPSSKNYAFNDETFEKVFNKSKEIDFNCLFPVEPLNINQRYHLQQSIFVCQGNAHKPLLEQLGFLQGSAEKAITKITIPINQKKTAIRDLIKMNITRATLFPGLDGFAQSLLMKYSSLASLGETVNFSEYPIEDIL